MSKKWGANITRHLDRGRADISDARMEKAAAHLALSDEIRDLRTIANLLESLPKPWPLALREALSIAERWRERQ